MANLVESLFNDMDALLKELFGAYEFPWQALPDLESYLAERITGSMEGSVCESAILEPDCLCLGEGSRILSHARIEGTVRIGKNCLIGHGALLRGAVYIGDNCVIGQGVEVKNIVVMDHSKLSHLNSIPDAIIGSNVGIAGGAMFANVTLYNSEVKATLADRRIRTGLKMFSAILGDSVQIGANAVVGPGAVLEQQSVVYPCVRFNGYAPRGTAIKENSY